jgi:hypothetical protein
MRHRLLLTIGAILVVCQLISVFWLWHESKEQIQLLVASAIEGHNNQKHIEHEVREAVASLLIPSLLIIGLALYIPAGGEKSPAAFQTAARAGKPHPGQPAAYHAEGIGS